MTPLRSYDACAPTSKSGSTAKLTPVCFKVHATAATQTFPAPAFRKMRAHSDAVVPVVNTSSTRKMPRPKICSGCCARNAPRTFSARCGRVSPVCDTVPRWRTSKFVASSALGMADSQVSTRIGCMAEMHSGHTGSREIFTRGAPQRRQSEGKSAANRPGATSAAPETAEFSRLRPWGTDVRVMSPVLLKTSLPRPAPG
jgi:hypothetical protein